MAMQENVREDRRERAMDAVNVEPQSEMERSLTEKPANLASKAVNARALGLLMGATSLIGPILADGSY